MRRAVPLIALALTCAGSSLSTGCNGEEKFDVKGKVTYNGKPLEMPGGQIVFIGPKGNQTPASIGSDGTYLATKVSAGLNQVVVFYPNPAAGPGGSKPARPKPGGPPAGPPLAAFLTPMKYASADTSGFSSKVEKGTVFDADLVGPKIR
jgi:hypothetical protein